MDEQADENEDGQDTPVTWRKARLPSLPPTATAEEALADIVQGCVEHLRGNEECLLARAHEEGVHQMRVAVRRLRSCFALYDRVIPLKQSTHITGELKWLIRELGPARDWDVFSGEVLAPVIGQITGEDRLETLAQKVGLQRDAAYARAQAAVSSQRYLGLVLLLGWWVESRGWRNAEGGLASETLPAPAQTIAHELLHEIYEQVLATGTDFEHLSAEQRHEVRIELKKLRYATEFFATLYPKRKVTPYLAAMKALQDGLGASNDLDVARKLLKQVIKPARGKERGRLAFAAGLVVGWHSHIGDDREQELIKAWSAFSRRAPYWEPRSSASRAGADDAAAPRGPGVAADAADGAPAVADPESPFPPPVPPASAARRRRAQPS